MSNFFERYLNLKKIMEQKREYRQQMERVKALPEDYQYVFKKIQQQMWQFVAGDGVDMMELQVNLLDLFEEGAAHGKTVLEITGPDVAAFVDALLCHVKTYPDDWRSQLNQDIRKKLKNSAESAEQ